MFDIHEEAIILPSAKLRLELSSAESLFPLAGTENRSGII